MSERMLRHINRAGIGIIIGAIVVGPIFGLHINLVGTIALIGAGVAVVAKIKGEARHLNTTEECRYCGGSGRIPK